MKVNTTKLLLTVDLIGVFVFALDGALTGIRANLDLFGVLVLSFVTALAGGVIRDVLIGDIPPASLRNWAYGAVAFGAGGFAFVFHEFVQNIPAMALIVLDAGGLSLFAVAGTEKALSRNMNPLIAALMGTITGVGGGTVRDILLTKIPIVLRADVYATAALAGAIVVIVCRRLRFPDALAAALGGFACFALRMVSVWRHWNLPSVGNL
jgi:uncharacterized membrane protein YeiH